MGISRTTQCLLTLSSNPEIARLVRSFSLRLSSRRTIQSSPDIIGHALSNMTGLISLSLQLGIFATSSVLSQATFRLTKLVCIVASDEAYPISKFLSTQSDIEELYIVGQPNGLAGLDADALPALRDLAAPLRLLPDLLRSRLSGISRLSILGTMFVIEDFVQLGTTLESAKAAVAIELAMGVYITAFLMTTDILAQGLGLLGRRAPFIKLLRLEIHRGHIKEYELQNVFEFALPEFINIRTLVIMSQSPTPGAYIRKAAHVQSQSLSSLPPAYNAPTAALSTVSLRCASPQLEYDEARDWLGSVPDALHDRSCHKQVLIAWHRAHPRLERVVFPVGVYTFANKERQNND
ncbi:hypothetical protein RSOLAG1IB_03122 [Rhizoctonia solani AG-1 IB]|uniref:Uncharacterized protein n=1 Tax=Thanatephorus cucumeris (strain AG1-IB / isolate 7/3/14) TaxID=1108050 RepID=A0A0B7FK50_THACB|nr:hypothetical protein RSOLAG1IB_03122 [Rhizoctonia solani AG-1 IB]